MKKNNVLSLKKGTEAQQLLINLIRLGAGSEMLQKATGKSRQFIAAIKAHDTMGTYQNARK